MQNRTIGLTTLLTAALLLAGCASAYYSTMEKFGIEKRDILTDRVEDAREAQGDAKEQLADALERYRSVINIEGGKLEKVYDRLNSSFKRSEARANEVTERINEIEEVADDLFDEWKTEIGEYSDIELRSQSEGLLADTQRDYRQMLSAMRQAEASMGPVLTLFNDQVLFLRHNLNARAIGTLDSELRTIELATSSAIRDMERSIEEASRFIQSMG